MDTTVSIETGLRESDSMTRRCLAHPVGVNADIKLIGCPTHLHVQAFVSKIPETTLPSADFCVLTPHVSMKGAIGSFMSRCLLCDSLYRDSYPSTATGYAGSLVN